MFADRRACGEMEEIERERERERMKKWTKTGDIKPDREEAQTSMIRET